MRHISHLQTPPLCFFWCSDYVYNVRVNISGAAACVGPLCHQGGGGVGGCSAVAGVAGRALIGQLRRAKQPSGLIVVLAGALHSCVPNHSA